MAQKTTGAIRATVQAVTPATVRSLMRETPDNIIARYGDSDALAIVRDVAAGNRHQDATVALANAMAYAMLEPDRKELGAYRLTQLGRHVTGTPAAKGGGVSSPEVQAAKDREKAARLNGLQSDVAAMLAHLVIHPTSAVATGKAERLIARCEKAEYYGNDLETLRDVYDTRVAAGLI